MKQRKADDAQAPSPERLAAYLDGELDTASRAQIAGWLRAHPDAAAELEEQRHLGRIWQDTPPPSPAEEDWDNILEHIVAKTTRRQTRRAGAAEEAVVNSGQALATVQPAGWTWHLRMAGTAAAIVLLVLGLNWRPAPQPTPQPDLTVRALPVAANDDVEIISVDAADTPFLVIGRLPARGPYVLAGPGDVVLESIEPDPKDGMMPTVRIDQNISDGPMIVAPLSVASNR